MTAPRVGLIVAHDSEFGIGRDGGIPWKYPQDIRFFRNATLGCGVVMGRKTWDSIPSRFRPLANRRNFVLSSRPLYPDCVTAPPGGERHPDFSSVMAAASVASPEPMHFLWVIGGAQLYNDPIIREEVDEIYDTTIEGDTGCDTFLDDWERYLDRFTRTWEREIEGGDHGPSTLTFRHFRRG